MRTVPITLTEGQAKELEALAASRGQTPVRAIQVALGLYAHASDAIRAGHHVLVASRDGVPLKQLVLRTQRGPMRTVAITLSEGHAREFKELAAARGQTPARALRFALALYAHASEAIRAGHQVLVADRDGVPLKRLTLRRDSTADSAPPRDGGCTLITPPYAQPASTGQGESGRRCTCEPIGHRAVIRDKCAVHPARTGARHE